jgi:hypothetical protein
VNIDELTRQACAYQAALKLLQERGEAVWRIEQQDIVPTAGELIDLVSKLLDGLSPHWWQGTKVPFSPLWQGRLSAPSAGVPPP